MCSKAWSMGANIPHRNRGRWTVLWSLLGPKKGVIPSHAMVLFRCEIEFDTRVFMVIVTFMCRRIDSSVWWLWSPLQGALTSIL